MTLSAELSCYVGQAYTKSRTPIFPFVTTLAHSQLEWNACFSQLLSEFQINFQQMVIIAAVNEPGDVFELFLDFGNRIKARSKAAQTFIVQLCGHSGYLPTQKAEKAGHYSAYISSGHVGHEGGDLYTRHSIEEINDLF